MTLTRKLCDHVTAEHSTHHYKDPETNILIQKLLARRNAPLYQVGSPLCEDLDDDQTDDLPDFIDIRLELQPETQRKSVPGFCV